MLIGQTSRRGVSVDNPYGIGVWVRVRAYGDTVGPWSAPQNLTASNIPDAPGKPVPILAPPTPVDYDPATATPIDARGFDGGVEPFWTDTVSEYLAAVNVWINTVNDPDTATYALTVPATRYQANFDPKTPGRGAVAGLDGNVKYYIWLQSVNTANIGGLFSTPVIEGTTYYTWEDLEGNLDESYLTILLQQRLDLIDDPATGLVQKANANEAAIRAEAARLQAEIDSLAANIGDLQGIPVWDATTNYIVGNIVKYNGALYDALKPNTNVQPDTDPTTWHRLGNYDSLVGLINANAAEITKNTAEITKVETDLGAQITSNANQLQLVSATINDPDNANSALAQGYRAIQSTVTTLDGDIKANTITDQRGQSVPRYRHSQ